MLAPERITRLVLVGAPATGDNEAVRGLREAIQALGDTVPRAFAHEFQSSSVHAPIPPAFLNSAVGESMRVPARVWRAVLSGMLEPSDLSALKDVRFPTLIIWGEKDAFFPKQEQDQLVQAIPNVRLLVYQRVGHSPHWERPAEFVRDLEAFLKQ